MTKKKSFQVDVAGKTVTVETGVLAPQADGACTVRIGDTVVLTTVVMSQETRPGVDFLPLMVDYEERLYAAGKIKGSRFIKREGRPTDEAILTSRLIDRGVRPLLPKHLRYDVQVVCTVLSYDSENDADIASLLGASIALGISGVPFEGPLSTVRVGRVNGEFVVNPPKTERKSSTLDLLVSAKEGKVLMIEAGANEISEADSLAAIKLAIEHTNTLNEFQKQIVSEVGKEQIEIPAKADVSELSEKVSAIIGDGFAELMKHSDKEPRNAAFEAIKADVVEKIKTESVEAGEAVVAGVEQRVSAAKQLVESLWEEYLRMHIVKTKTRIGGRKSDEVRQLEVEVGLFPRTHGSGFFQRGQTQGLTLATLGSPSMEQILDGMEVEEKKRYMHHYNFPPFSVGETKPMRSPGRREIGHGALAERALEAVLPAQEDFPYTIRLVTEVLSSSGSTSMAATCGSTLALMDAGVPISKPVSGIAMGLMTDPGDTYGNFVVLTDIQDAEDFAGDADFKIAGTADGITAMQMDTKLKGLSMEMIEQTLTQGLAGRLHILKAMTDVIDKPRAEMSKYAPRLVSFEIDKDKIRTVIGKGGEMINKIIEETGVEIDINDDAIVTVASEDGESLKKAVEWIKNLTTDPKPGEKYDGKITRLMDFGAFAEILPGKEGLIHISELAEQRIDHPGDVIKEGDVIPVQVLEIDHMGRLNLSHLAAIGKSRPKPEGRDDRGPRRGGGGPGRGGGRGFGGGGDRRGGSRPPSRGGFGSDRG